MAKEAKVKEPTVEDKKTAQDTDGKTEIVVVGEENKEVVTKKDDEITPEKRIEELQAQMAASDKARKDAEERAVAADKARQEAVSKATGSENSAITAKERELASATLAVATSVTKFEDQYQSALEAGDSKAAREANTLLQKELIKQARIEEASTQFTAWKKQQEEIAKQPKQNQGPSPAAQAWIAKNPRFNQDAEYAQEAEAAYTLGVKRGFQPDSIEHYKFVDSRLKQIYNDGEANEIVVTPDPKPVKQQSYSAPPSRGSNGDGGNQSSGNQKIYLTKAQVRAAEVCGMTPLEYAQQLQAEKERQ